MMDAGIDDPEQSKNTRAALLLEFLRTGDAPCPTCGYNLRSLTGNVCPECGQSFELRVGARHARFGHLVMVLVPPLALAGFALFFGFACLAWGPPPRRQWGFLVLALLGALSALAAPFIYRYRLLILQQSRPVQLGIVAAVWFTYAVAYFLCLTFGTR